MIDDDELVCGAHISLLSDELNMRTLDIQHLTALHNSRYTELVGKKNKLKPLASGSLSLLVRFLLRHQEYSPIRRAPTIHQLLEVIQSIPGYEDFSKRQVGPLLGCEVGSSYRWFNPEKASKDGSNKRNSSGTSPIVDRLVTLLYTNLEGRDIAERKAFFERYLDVLAEERNARGIDDVEFQERGFTRKRFIEKIEKEGFDPSYYVTVKKKPADVESRSPAKSKRKKKPEAA